MPPTRSLLAGACLAAAAGAAAAQDVELSCIDALSSKLGVAMGEVDVRTRKPEPGGGTAVHATVNLAPWTCHVDDAGKVTSIDRG